MAVKTTFTNDDFATILAQYDLGDLLYAESVSEGTVQTNYILHTSRDKSRGKCVFRCYENRSVESVLFERDLLSYLSTRSFPCPAPIRNRHDETVGTARDKPYMLFEFCEGKQVADPSDEQWRQLIQTAAKLHTLTQGFRSPYVAYRWNYDPERCRRLALAEAERIDTADAYAKYAWLSDELETLRLPPALPKGVCHCDFHPSNVLYQGDHLVALLDFDDANNTYLQFDLVGLIEYQAWPNDAELLDMAKTREVVQTYQRYRPMPLIERQHTFDVYQLSILFDCVWYFDRGSVRSFRERAKIEALQKLGRERFFAQLFQS